MAGSWYPDDPEALRAEVELYLAAGQGASVPGRLVALISPHAGLRYSGPVAAWGYGLLRGRERLTAVLVGPSHRMAFEGVSVVPRGAFETPLGEVPIDEELARDLALRSDVVRDLPRPHRDEHSLEMQLPFLRHVVRDLHIVPLLMGSQSRAEVDALSDVLADVLAGRDVLLVASSDLSHYLPAPAAQRMDAVVIDHLAACDPRGLMDSLEADPSHACGGGAMVAVLEAARRLGADACTVLRYADSGDEGSHDKSRVVGYVSAAASGRA